MSHCESSDQVLGTGRQLVVVGGGDVVFDGRSIRVAIGLRQQISVRVQLQTRVIGTLEYVTTTLGTSDEHDMCESICAVSSLQK